MRYLAFAADYDGTLAHHGRVSESTVSGLKRLRDSGRRLLIVTGRVLPELMEIFPDLDLFERIVAENGALLYDPKTKTETILAEPPPEDFAKRLVALGVHPISCGRVIVATWEPYEQIVLKVIQEMGLELQVIFNKGAVMVLPSGANKATGLAAALKELGISPHNCVGIGDAENDHAFLALCECSAAVANALQPLKDRADIVTRADHGDGVMEIIDELLADDLKGMAPRLLRHRIALGQSMNGEDVFLEPHGLNVMVAGSSGSGKSTLTTGLLERWQTAGYQFLIVDPEGDYSTLENVVMIGDPQRPPLVEEILDLLAMPGPSLVVNLLGVALEHRPAFFDSLLPRLQSHRSSTGRPHWIVLDEAHHLMHAEYAPASHSLPNRLQNMLFITVHPESVWSSIIESIDVLITVGETPDKTFASFCTPLNRTPPSIDSAALPPGNAIVWRPGDDTLPIQIAFDPPKAERRRHSRKYAEGSLGADNSFYFRGPEQKLNLRAQNLTVFLQLADGVDVETWDHHLAAHEFSRWFRDKIKDDSLADAVEEIEQSGEPAEETKRRVREEVESRYTLSAERASGIQDDADKSE